MFADGAVGMNRSEVDDRSLAARDHTPCHRLGHEVHGPDVDVEEGVELMGLHVGKRDVGGDTRIVDQHVDATQELFGAHGEIEHGIDVVEVGLKRRGSASHSFNLFDRGLCPGVTVTVVQDHIGAVLGGIVGSEVGKSLDRADRAHMHRTTQQSLESQRTGEPSTWSNPDNRHSGTVTPTRTYRRDSGENCREFQQTVTIDGRTERAYGTACRQSDGSWKIVS